MQSRHTLIAALIALAPGLVWADDRDTYTAAPLAPNVMFLLDDSGSMQDLACEDFAQSCFNPPGSNSEMLFQSGPNGSSECHSPSVDSLGYSNTVTYPYPDTDFPKPGGSGYPPSSGYLSNFVSADVYDRSGFKVDATSISAFCTNETNFPNCQQRSRCIYMLTNFGYFYEGQNCIGVGDPMGMCPTGTKQNALTCATTGGVVGTACTKASDCGCSSSVSGSNACVSSKCGECVKDGDCKNSTQSCDADAQGVNRCVNELDPQDMTGNLLNLYPPKLVAARAVLKAVVRDYSSTTKIRERMGLMVYNGSGSGGILQAELGPMCGPTTTCMDGTCDASFESWRTGMVSTIDALSFGTSTPLGETLDDIGCYYSNSHGPACTLTNTSGAVGTGANTVPDPPACASTGGAPGSACSSTSACGCGICKAVGGSKSKQCQECAVDGDCTGSSTCVLGSDNVNHCYGPSATTGGFTGLKNGPPICDSCQKNFAVVVTDGFPNGDGPAVDGNPAGSGTGHQPVTQSYYATQTLMLNDDPQHYLVSVVAKNLFSHDLDNTLAGTQNVVSYAISFGVSDPLNPSACAGVLARTGQNGGGQCFLAKNSASLASSLNSILQNIQQVTQSFTGPALQSSRAQGDNSANLALFRADPTGPLWEGHLYALQLWDESLLGDFPGGNPLIHNEIFVLDATGAIVTFDNSGNLLSTPYWDAALCLAGDAANTVAPVSPQDPHNLDVSGCYRSGDETQASPRQIFTSVTGLQGTADPFTIANEPALHTQLGLAPALLPCTSATSSLACAGNKIIGFFRGLDMLDRKGRGTVNPVLDRNLSNLGTTAGWWKLGDIFHSIPTTISQPQELSTTSFGGPGTSYAQYMAANASRERMLLAGANDGMIHAFDAGHWGGTAYDHGNGAELWAFVPPHLLPKLGSMLNCPSDLTSPCTVADKYEYFVDGSPQVRDVYTAANGSLGTTVNLAAPGNAANWKTVAVIGDRDGGTKFTALDVTNPNAPKFLWEFPSALQLGAGPGQRAEPAGSSWSDAYPNPAPIMPVTFLDGTGNPYLRWVAVVNGGFSRNQTAGRGIYMLDAYTGTLLWKWEYKVGASDDRQYMTYSFAAPAGMVSPATPKAGLPGVQYILAVDTGGQVWRFDVSTPQAVGLGALATWTGKRLFATAAPSATTSAYGAAPAGGTLIDITHYPYRPMFQVVSGAWGDTGDLWILVGTGDRDLLTNPTSPTPSGFTLDAEVVKEVCGQSPYTSGTYLNRIYGLDADKLAALTSVGTEDNLTNVTGSPGQVIKPTTIKSGGWFLELRPGEKVNNPADIFDAAAYFTTFTPPTSCGLVSTTQTCTAPSGSGTLYVLNYQTGLPILNLTNTDSGATFGTYSGKNGAGAGTISSADASVALGTGIPSAPNVSFGQQGKSQSGALVVSTSANSSPTAVSAKTDDSAGTLLYELQVPRSLHDTFLQYGTTH